MDDITRVALERKNALQAQIQALQQELDDLGTFLRVAARLTSPVSRSAASKTDGRRAGSVVAKTVELAKARILAAGRPLPVAHLHDLLANDVEIGGQDPNATLSARLSNSHAFTSHRGLGWWPNDHPLPSLFAKPDEKEAAEASHSNPAASSEVPPQKESEHAAALAEML